MISSKVWKGVGSLCNKQLRCLCSLPTNGPVKLAYASFQDTNKPPQGAPVLFLHGLLGSKTNWQSIAKAISKTGRKTITVDVRNHGESPHTPDMTYISMAADVIELLQDLDIDKSIIVGHSMGGRIAMTVALTHPEIVAKLVVADVSPAPSPSEAVSAFPGFLAAMQGVYFDQSMETISEVRRDVDRQLQDIFPDVSVRNFILTNIERRNDVYQWRVNMDSIMRHIYHLRRFPEIHSTYEGDTLFIGGRESPYISQEHETEIKRLFPKAHIEFIDGAGHWVHSDKPYDFLSLVNKMILAQS